MKVAFSRAVDYTPEWRGNRDLPEQERCKIILKPLEMADLVLLMDKLQEASGGTVDQESLTALAEATTTEQIRGLIDTCGELVPTHCEVINLEDASGNISAEDIVRFPFYMELTAELLSELANISMPNEEEEKNSEPQPDIANMSTR